MYQSTPKKGKYKQRIITTLPGKTRQRIIPKKALRTAGLTGGVGAKEGSEDLKAAGATGLHGGNSLGSLDECGPEGRRVVPRVARVEEVVGNVNRAPSFAVRFVHERLDKLCEREKGGRKKKGWRG